MKPFKDLTKNEIKKHCNGCGGKGGFLNPPEFIFHASCNHHDYLYSIGGTKADRKKADKAFLKYMLKDSEGSLKYRAIAYSYYFAVRLFGKKYFGVQTIEEI